MTSNGPRVSTPDSTTPGHRSPSPACRRVLVPSREPLVFCRRSSTSVLGYLRLGQPAPTLSGGEAQRVKLASELGRRSTGRTFYILDEPTTGLHFEDIRKLLGVIGRLVDSGNTVVIIEHNLDVIKTADWIVDLGPEGGDEGGAIVAEGPPETIITIPESYTGKFLREVLQGARWLVRCRKWHRCPATTNPHRERQDREHPDGSEHPRSIVAEVPDPS